MYIKATPVEIGHPGIGYLDFLTLTSKYLVPRLYFEIGTNTGMSLRQFICNSICVDPHFTLQGNVLTSKRCTTFYQMTSDEFFRTSHREMFTPGIDVAFLDGLHRFEYLLRDFMNTEKYCSDRATVLIHDCLPTSPEMVERHSETCVNWAGDVWKFLFVLKQYREDLVIRVFDCPPTGLVGCTRLDPSNDALKKNYHRILEQFGRMQWESNAHELWQLFPVVDTGLLRTRPYDLTLLL